MKRIAVINDLSGLGKCSLTAAIPVISAMGVQACPMPTAILSNQTGYPSYYCEDCTRFMKPYMDELDQRRFAPDAISTGYLSKAQQVSEIINFVQRFTKPDTLVIVDPVMGDQGHGYAAFTEAMQEQMCRLVSHAHIITPNLTEALLLLYGNNGLKERWDFFDVSEREALLCAAEELAQELCHRFSLRGLVITGINCRTPTGEQQIGNLILESDSIQWVFQKKLGGNYSGTGDLFSSVLAGGLTLGMSLYACVTLAVEFLSPAIRDAVEEQIDKNDGVCFERYLYILMERCRKKKGLL